MKRIIIVLCAASFYLTAFAQETAMQKSNQQKSSKKPGWISVDSATAMKSMMETGTPGKEHAMLTKADGEWTAETTMWMSPDAPPVKATSVAVNQMIMGGRYQQTSFKGDFMGMPFEGISTTGYDKAKKKYFNSWIDNMSTGVMNMEGTWDDATRSIQFKGKMLCPANGKECEMRQVFKIKDENTHVMEMYGPDMKTGKEYKTMEITFTRK